MKTIIKWYNRIKFINKIYLIPKEIISCINKYNYLCYKENIDSCIYGKDEFIIIARKLLIDTNICTKRNKKYSTLEV